MHKKPRILYISAFDIPGAGNRVLMNWLSWLEKHGYGLYVACPARGWLAEKLQGFPKKHILNAEFPIPSRKNALKSLLTALTLSVFIVRHRVDVIHCNSDQAYYLACLASRLTRRPIVTHLRFHYSQEFYMWMFGKWRRPDLIVLVSEAFRKEEIAKLERAAPTTSVEVLHNCINPTAYIPVNPQVNVESVEIFYPAAISERKRQHHLYKIDRHLQRRGYELKFLSTGKINQHDYWQLCLEESGRNPQNNVEFMGHVDNVAEHYKSAFLSVSTSVYETFGYSVLESMAMGVPVVGYQNDAVAEVLGNSGILVESDDYESLAEVIIELKQRPGEWSRLASLSRLRAENYFSQEYICPQLLAYYESVIARDVTVRRE